MTDLSGFDETEDGSEVVELSDLMLGFGWHDEGQHWDLESVSFPDTFTDEQVDRLAQLAGEFAERLTQEGFLLPAEAEA